MTKFKELKTKSPTELRKMIEERNASLREFRFGLSGGKVKDVRSARNMKKDMARALTIINNQAKVEALPAQAGPKK